ncbi:hypothetical protein [Diaphorobacter nitroreducens]|uniref:hypothetical protein n=1 Tax=Diaphorobacter nitroreducens TaxID=164759 RepID=UPI0028993C17|nr:hypothetical protein [Diaphorobacter nitroreducens]
MYVLTCATQTVPCPLAEQAAVSFSSAVDLAALGLTSQALLYVYAWGVMAVLGLWALGWVVGVVVGVIQRA